MCVWPKRVCITISFQGWPTAPSNPKPSGATSPRTRSFLTRSLGPTRLPPRAAMKTFHQRNVYGMSVLTLLTVQNTCSVDAVEPFAPGFVLAQLDSVLADLPPHAAKTAALGTCEIIEAIARRAAHFSFPLVVDPVMISKHGALLLPEEAQKTLVQELF